MYPLIEQCLAGDEHAWDKLRHVYDHFAGQPIRRLVQSAGFDANEADDVACDVFEQFWINDHRKLRTFGGSTDAELHNWLVHSAINLARNYIKRLWRARKRERARRKSVPRPRRDGPTEREVTTFLTDLEKVLSMDKVSRLRELAGLDSSPPESDRDGAARDA